MSLQQLLDLSASRNIVKEEVSEERLLKNMEAIRKQIAFYREYPDLFVDDIKGPECTFKFRFTQRIFLRSIMRHRYVYCVFTRGFSKSFLAIMGLMLKAILFPGSKVFVTTGGKEQAALITISKVEEICKLIPSLSNEINWDRGVSTKSKDNVKYVFKNSSELDILAARESTRGQRRNGGVIEEVILVDETALNEIIIPTTNVDRNLPNGTTDPDEVVNQSQCYITSAGWKNSFAYNKLLEILLNSVLFPDKFMVLGGDYKLAILEGAVKADMVEEMKINGTYNESSFDREYGSIWSGDAENAYFSNDIFEKHRVLLQPEKEYSGRSSKNAYYVVSVDVGRKGCNSEATIIKVTPQPQGDAIKTLVNIYSLEAEHFETQAIHIKKLYYKYHARSVVIDANGLGVGLIDFMVKAQIDPETGDELVPFGVEGGTYDEAAQDYKKFKTDDMERDAMFLVKANAPINTEAHAYVQTQMGSGKIKFLIDEQTAKTKLLGTKIGQNMTPEERNDYLRPFQQTTILKEQMLNLVEDNEGVNVILKQNNRGIPKDKFSAFEYGLYYIKLEEEKRKRRKKRDISSMLFFS
jgi:hypothetical protein